MSRSSKHLPQLPGKGVVEIRTTDPKLKEGGRRYLKMRQANRKASAGSEETAARLIASSNRASHSGPPSARSKMGGEKRESLRHTA